MNFEVNNTKFKVGDKVEVLIDCNGRDNQSTRKKGSIGVIHNFYTRSIPFKWASLGANECYINSEYLKKVSTTWREKYGRNE